MASKSGQRMPSHASKGTAPASLGRDRDASPVRSARSAELANIDLWSDPTTDPVSRLEGDAALVDVLREDAFKGPRWERFAMELASYGLPVVRSWVITGTARHGTIGPYFVPRVSPNWEQLMDDAIEIAGETIAFALRDFRCKVLIPGLWSPREGASLKTYFIGQCLFKLPNVCRRWAREAKPVPGRIPADDVDVVDTRSDVDLARLAELGDELRCLRRLNKDKRGWAAACLRAEGYSQAEIGELFGVTEKAIELMLYRLRRHILSMPQFQQDSKKQQASQAPSEQAKRGS